MAQEHQRWRSWRIRIALLTISVAVSRPVVAAETVKICDGRRVSVRATALSCDGVRPANLANLSRLVGLRNLTLRFVGPVNSLSFLAGLRKVTRLSLSFELGRRVVIDLRPLSTMSLLRELTIEWAKLNNLAGLPAAHLEVLKLDTTELASIAGLSAFTRLRTLILSRASIKDLSFLQGMSRLERLSLGSAPRVGYEKLARLTKLRHLVLEPECCVGPANLLPLGALSGLHSLKLSVGAPHTNLSFIARLTQLKKLDISGFELRGAPFLRRLTRVTSLRLDCGGGQLDLRDLRQLRTLEKLSIKAATIRSFDVLRNFTTLRGLWFEDVNVNDRMLAHIAGLTRLEELGLEGTRVTKLAPLSRLTRLLILNLEESPVRSLRSLRKLTRLQQIFLSGTKVKKGSCRRLQRINKTLEINDCP